MRFQPVFSGAGVDFGGDLVGEREGGFHDDGDLFGEGICFVLVEVEDEIVVDLEEHFGLGLLLHCRTIWLSGTNTCSYWTMGMMIA